MIGVVGACQEWDGGWKGGAKMGKTNESLDVYHNDELNWRMAFSRGVYLTTLFAYFLAYLLD